jgi:glycosyltransferase involved in cell wall biosynthesis
MVNPEFVKDWDAENIIAGKVDVVICRTEQCERIMVEFMQRNLVAITRARLMVKKPAVVVIKTYFTSKIICGLKPQTLLLHHSPRPLFVCFAGTSYLKGIDRLVAAWTSKEYTLPLVDIIVFRREAPKLGGFYDREMAEWQELIKSKAASPIAEFRSLPLARAHQYRGLIIVQSKIDINAMQALMHAATACICLSKTEGWGHYLHEALACGKPIIAIDAPPVNEFVVDGVNGFMVAATVSPLTSNRAIPLGRDTFYSKEINTPVFLADSAAIVRAISRAAITPADQLAEMGARSKAAFNTRTGYFRRTVAELCGKINE